jgi:hypothetical protein
MICPRCGTVQRRETARFCHQCGATIEQAPTEVQLESTEMPALEPTEAAPQDVQPPSPAALPPEPINPMPEEQTRPESSLPQPPAALSPEWQEEAPTIQDRPPPAPPVEQQRQWAAPAAPPAWEAPPRWERTAPSFEHQQGRFASVATDQAFVPERPQMPVESLERGPRPAPSIWTAEPANWERQPSYGVPQAEEALVVSARAFSPPQNIQGNPNQGGIESHAEPPIPWQAAPAEPPSRSAARGPVPGALQRSRPVQQRRRLPLGIIIPLALLLVFVIAGVGVYVFASGSASQEPSAFLTYNDPNHHFHIQYPTVWTATPIANGVRFSDATHTAELSVTYTPNTQNLTADQFADQEAAKENISTPDTQTFAGTTWVQRSGIVTQTSGISQDIFLFVTVSNNFLYEVREVAPLDGYKEPNQTAFMPMLQSLALT